MTCWLMPQRQFSPLSWFPFAVHSWQYTVEHRCSEPRVWLRAAWTRQSVHLQHVSRWFPSNIMASFTECLKKINSCFVASATQRTPLPMTTANVFSRLSTQPLTADHSNRSSFSLCQIAFVRICCGTILLLTPSASLCVVQRRLLALVRVPIGQWAVPRWWQRSVSGGYRGRTTRQFILHLELANTWCSSTKCPDTNPPWP